MKQERLISFLKEQVKPAIGCTEPIAIALAVAWVRKYCPGELVTLTVEVSNSIYKNGFGVTIPGTVETGNKFAAALAWVIGNSQLGLEVLRDVDQAAVQSAHAIVDRVKIYACSDYQDVYIKAVGTTTQHVASCVVAGRHDNVVSIVQDDVVVRRNCQTVAERSASSLSITNYTFAQIRTAVEQLDADQLEFLAAGAAMNYQMAQQGLMAASGLGVGVKMKTLMQAGLIEENILNHIRMVSAAAADGRMGGIALPVMSSAGSGNHGITAILPVYLLAEHLQKSRSDLLKSLAFSHLITSYVKAHTGRLSAICGCSVAAGVGAAAAITWLLGGRDSEIGRAVNYMIANLAGMICDGAKPGCATKISTAAGEAVLAAYLAMENETTVNIGGIVSPMPEQTIRNLQAMAVQGMGLLDKTLLNILSEEELRNG